MAAKKSKFREYVEAVAIAILLALLIRTFVVQAFKIPSGSMEDTLAIGDQILVTKFIYGLKVPFVDTRFFILRQPRRGDIIVFSYPGNNEKEECTSFSKNAAMRFDQAWNNRNPVDLFGDDCRDFIKRVIGVGGDKVEVKNKAVYVNGIALVEPYAVHKDKNGDIASSSPRDNYGPVTVPHGKFFVMGDNRDNSSDSRFWGFVDMTDIKGKAFVIYWSWNKDDEWYKKIRFGRLGKVVR